MHTWTRGFDCNGRLGPDEGAPPRLPSEPPEHMGAVQGESHRGRGDRDHDRLRHPGGARPIPRPPRSDLLARAIGGCHQARHILAGRYVYLSLRRGCTYHLAHLVAVTHDLDII